MTDPFELLRRQFIARCRTELEQLRDLAPDDPGIGPMAHRLAGSAGSFGYHEVSEAAAVVDDKARFGPPDPGADEIRALIESLQKAIAREPEPGVVGPVPAGQIPDKSPTSREAHPRLQTTGNGPRSTTPFTPGDI